jgi:hypothetical protein
MAKSRNTMVHWLRESFGEECQEASLIAPAAIFAVPLYRPVIEWTMSTNKFEPDPRFAAANVSRGDRTWESTPELRFFAHSLGDTPTLQQQWKCIESGEREWREVPIVTGSTMLNDNES